MNSTELVDSFSEFKELKNIDKQTMQHVLEDVFRAMFKKKFKSVQVLNVKGKQKRFGRFDGKRNDVRKAYVSLKPGQEINFAQEVK